MKKILAFNGGPRKQGNTSIMLESFLKGAKDAGSMTEQINTYDIDLKHCSGCLRCNVLKYCSLKEDDWQSISEKIMQSDVLVFATPVYFHHVTASLKKIIDRFRSFVNVEITEEGLKHTPWQTWNKEFVLLLSMGSSDDSEADPIIELFQFMCSILGTENKLHVVKAIRLAVSGQIIKTNEELEKLYVKLKLPSNLVYTDFRRNQIILNKSYRLGASLS